MFQIGDKIVHPMHGAGVIDGMVTEKMAGAVADYYVFKMPVGGLVLKIPVASSETIGLRNIITREEAQTLLKAISEMDVEMNSNWNHRYRENMERLKSGNLYEVAHVIKGLTYRDTERMLSNGERKMLHTAKQILISELVLCTEQDSRAVERQVYLAMVGEQAG